MRISERRFCICLSKSVRGIDEARNMPMFRRKHQLVHPSSNFRNRPFLFKNSKNEAPRKSRRMRWEATFLVRRRLESAAVVFGGFLVNPVGFPTSFFIRLAPRGSKISIGGQKRVFQQNQRDIADAPPTVSELIAAIQ
jgi:hypothetical protein